MILHCVWIRFKATLRPEERAAIYAALAALRDVIPGMVSVSCGPNVSPEGLQGGFLDGFVVTFENADARDRYLVHPDHVAVGKRIVTAAEGGVSGLLVFDLAT
ncbi:Dabb family protein [Aureimonas sp. AU20]|uniref:Dabb family protein n=1 Tax=Aureimonas sp. AU20 TaxID=1349819 RepID=UPI0007201835|nr:Dabb family protein [Aureimonas sp. AU20]ALN71443.1 hypothetical protein M673_01895 [Aureimonas sp. AU20]